MVDRVEFSPLGGVDPRQLFAQREARTALINSLATAAPQISAPAPGSGPAPAPAPEPAQPAERAQRRTREEDAQQNPAARNTGQNTAPALGGAREAPVPGGPAQPPDAADLALEARVGEAFQIPVPGTDAARAVGAPLFGGEALGSGGPANPLTQEFFTPIGGGRGNEQNVPGPRPLGGGPDGTPAALGSGRAEPPVAPQTPQNAAPEQQGQNEPRGSRVDVLV